MKVISRRAARRSYIADLFTTGNDLPLVDIDLTQMKIPRLKTIGMINVNRVAPRIGAARASPRRRTVSALNRTALNVAYRPIGGRINRRRSAAGNIQPLMNIATRTARTIITCNIGTPRPWPGQMDVLRQHFTSKAANTKRNREHCNKKQR